MKSAKPRRNRSKRFDVGSLGPIEKIHHDVHKESVNDERFHEAEEFIRACESVALWRLREGRRSEDAGFYIGELAQQMAATLENLAKAGDLGLARRLPSIAETIARAHQVFGDKFDNTITHRPSIEELLQKHRAIELIQIFAALHPDWAQLCGIEDGKKLLRRSEAELRALLLSEEEWVRVGAEDDMEKRKHRLAQFIERAYAIRQMQGPNINFFVENLWQGRLWSGPNGTFEDCNWPSRPPREDVSAWMRLIIPFLRKVTNDDAMKIGVFREMLAWRSCLADGQPIDVERGARLATASSADVWNQIRAEIRSAWSRMEKQARKQTFGNSA